MSNRPAKFDRKRLILNLVGYLIVLTLYLAGPQMSGFMEQAVWAYIWFYPIIYGGTLIYRYGRQMGNGE